MNVKGLAVVAFVVLGIIALLYSVSMLQGLLMFPFFQDEFEGKAWAVGLAWAFPFLLVVAGGVFLLVKRSWLAAWISHESHEGPSEESSEQLPALAF
ncbi:MAG: hypothetical protein K8R59_03460, partial [Thermoanaerobaculales bacterium]|nr:hypothetical protein [Thermoanaerobaculales bacterium]